MSLKSVWNVETLKEKKREAERQRRKKGKSTETLILTFDKGNEPIYHIALLHLGSNATQRFHDLLPDNRLLHNAKRFQGRQQHMGVLHSSDVGDKAAQLIRHSQRHFIVFIIVLVEEGYKLFMRPLLTECPCDGGWSSAATEYHHSSARR
jgi:hypothetical protein